MESFGRPHAKDTHGRTAGAFPSGYRSAVPALAELSFDEAVDKLGSQPLAELLRLIGQGSGLESSAFQSAP
jgi:hypothetical protein